MPEANMRSAGLRELIRGRATRNPDAAALLAPGCEPLTYGRLSDHIDSVGRTLHAQGIQRDDSVAVVLPNGPDMASAFLGVAAHFRCAPLNPSYRGEEFEFYLKDLQAKAVVVSSEIDSPARETAAQLGLTLLEIRPSMNQPAGCFSFPSLQDETDAVPDVGRNDDVALILHTSGTTSRPKQVPLTHRNLCVGRQYCPGAPTPPRIAA